MPGASVSDPLVVEEMGEPLTSSYGTMDSNHFGTQKTEFLEWIKHDPHFELDDYDAEPLSWKERISNGFQWRGVFAIFAAVLSGYVCVPLAKKFADGHVEEENGRLILDILLPFAAGASVFALSAPATWRVATEKTLKPWEKIRAPCSVLDHLDNATGKVGAGAPNAWYIAKNVSAPYSYALIPFGLAVPFCVNAPDLRQIFSDVKNLKYVLLLYDVIFRTDKNQIKRRQDLKKLIEALAMVVEAIKEMTPEELRNWYCQIREAETIGEQLQIIFKRRPKKFQPKSIYFRFFIFLGLIIGGFGQLPYYYSGADSITDFFKWSSHLVNRSAEWVNDSFFQDGIAVIFGAFFSLRWNGPIGMRSFGFCVEGLGNFIANKCQKTLEKPKTTRTIGTYFIGVFLLILVIGFAASVGLSNWVSGEEADGRRAFPTAINLFSALTTFAIFFRALKSSFMDPVVNSHNPHEKKREEAIKMVNYLSKSLSNLSPEHSEGACRLLIDDLQVLQNTQDTGSHSDALTC